MTNTLRISAVFAVVLLWAMAPTSTHGPLAPVLGALRTAPAAASPAAAPGPDGADAAEAEEPSVLSGVGESFDESMSPLTETGFFDREPFAFDQETVVSLGDDAAALARRVAGAVTNVGEPGGARALVPWLVMLLLGVVALLVDRRVRKKALRHVDERLALTELRPRLRVLESTGMRIVGQVATPAVAFGLVHFPLSGLFGQAHWTMALADALWIFGLYRVLVACARALLLGPLASVAPDAGRRLLTGALFGGRVAVAMLIAGGLAEDFGYRPDVAALLHTAFRAAVLLTWLWLLLRRRDLLQLFPVEGESRYQMFRKAVARWVGPLLWASAALLLLYALGFERAAVTILVRSYAIVGLLVAIALLDRWHDRLLRAGTERQRALLEAIRRRTDVLVTLVIRVVVGIAVLSILGLWGPLVSVLQTPLFTVGSSAISAWNLIKAGAIIAGFVLLSRAVRVVLEEVVFPRKGLDMGVGYAIVTAVHYVLLLNGIGIGLIALGIDLSALAVFAGALGVGIGLGLQDVVRNLISGFILLFGGIVKKGDLITVKDTYIGRIVSIGSRSVTVRTNDHSDLIIPSTDLVNSTIINWTGSSPAVRLRIPVGVSYGSSPPAVREALLEAAGRYDKILTTPAADVWLAGFGDSSVDFTLVVWIDAVNTPRDEATGKVLFHVWDVLAERGIEIPFPQRDLHIRSVSEVAARGLRGG